MDNDEIVMRDIMLIVAAMIADGRPAYNDANVTTMVRQAIKCRHEIYKRAKLELAVLAAKEVDEQKALAAAEAGIDGAA